MFAEWELSFKDGRLVSTAFDGSNGIDLEIGKDIKVTRVGPMLLVNYYGGPYSDAHLVYGLILTIVEDTDGKPPALRLLEAYEVVQDGKGEFGIDDAEKVSFTIIPADIKAVE